VGARVSKIGLGFQTISDGGLRAVSRPKNLPRFERAVRLLQERRINFYVDVIYGLPETTVADFLRTIDYLHSLGTTSIVTYRLLGLPGSPMLEDVDKYGLVFSQAPPYELLASSSFTIEDVVFCERYSQAYQLLSAKLQPRLLDNFARMTGGVSRLITELLNRGFSQTTDPSAVTSMFADIMRTAPASPALGTAPAPQPAEDRSLPVMR
jgi:hypothetical protein